MLLDIAMPEMNGIRVHEAAQGAGAPARDDHPQRIEEVRLRQE
jgi:CheY-like chemotaxis protein